MKAKLGLLLALVLAGCLSGVGCTGSSQRGWSGPVVVDDALYLGALEGEVFAYTLVDDPRPSAGQWWSFEPDERGVAYFYSTPTLADGIVYIGIYRGKLYALDAESGMLIWEYLR